MRRGERIAAAGAVLHDELDALPGHDLEARDVVAGALLRQTQEFEAGFRRGHADKRGFDRARPRHQAQHRRGDDAERAFRADEQVFQIVAGIVLFQLVEIVEHAAVGQHHFETERVRAGDAIRQRSGAAGIGGEIAADGAGAFGRQQLRIEPVGRGGGFARALQGDAGLAGDRVRGRIDFADAVEPVERQHDLVVVRDLPADQAGIAALRHDRRFRRVGELEDCRYFRDRGRPQHHRRVALEQMPHLDEIRRLQRRIGDGVFFADDGGEAGQQSWVHFGLRLIGRLIEHRAVPWRSSIQINDSRIYRGASRVQRGLAARASLSLIASPRSACGTGMTAIVFAPAASSARRCENRLAAASIRSPRCGQVHHAASALPAPAARFGPNASKASPRSTRSALSRSGVRGA